MRCLLIHGDHDGLINCAQNETLQTAISAAGANHEDEAFHKPAVLAATAGFFSAALTRQQSR